MLKLSSAQHQPSFANLHCPNQSKFVSKAGAARNRSIFVCWLGTCFRQPSWWQWQPWSARQASKSCDYGERQNNERTRETEEGDDASAMSRDFSWSVGGLAGWMSGIMLVFWRCHHSLAEMVIQVGERSHVGILAYLVYSQSMIITQQFNLFSIAGSSTNMYKHTLILQSLCINFSSRPRFPSQHILKKMFFLARYYGGIYY